MKKNGYTEDKAQVVRGLEGIVAAETDISFVDGENADLYYKGYNITDIAEHTYAWTEVIYLLLHGELATEKQITTLRRRIISEMRIPTQVQDMLEIMPPSTHPMDMLRMAVAALSVFDPLGEENTMEANYDKGIRLIAQIPTLIASFYRIRNHKPVLSPDPQISVAGNFLYMMHGKMPKENHAKAMDLLFLLHADHGLNASTFSARVTASTWADIHAAVTSALGTLKGPLHGGANERVMKMLLKIKNEEEVETYINTMLAQGERVMGFGHRIYKKEDPRARHLRSLSEVLCEEQGNSHLYKISHRIENVVLQAKGIFPNVDFYSATVQHALNIPVNFYTAVFAASRISGWVAHILDQYKNNRLIRPTSKYTGSYNRKWIPIEEREEHQRKKKEEQASA